MNTGAELHQYVTSMREDELLVSVLELAQTLNIRVVHHRPAKTEKGWRTAIQGHRAAGFPDLVLCGRGGVLFRELKSQSGKPSPDQLDWVRDLAKAGADAAVWRPQHWAGGTIRAEMEKIR